MECQIYFSFCESVIDDHTKEKILKLEKRIHVTKRWRIQLSDESLSSNNREYDSLHYALLTSKVFICFLNESYLKSTKCMKELTFAVQMKKKIIVYLLEYIALDRLKGIDVSADTKWLKGYQDDLKMTGYGDNFKMLVRLLAELIDRRSDESTKDESVEIPKKISPKIVDVKVESKKKEGSGGFMCCGKKKSTSTITPAVNDTVAVISQPTQDLSADLKLALERIMSAYENLIGRSTNEELSSEAMRDEMEKCERLEVEIKVAFVRFKNVPEISYAANDVKFPDNDKLMILDMTKFTLELEQYYLQSLIDSKMVVKDQRVYEETHEAWRSDLQSLYETDSDITERKMSIITQQRIMYSDTELERLNQILGVREKHFREIEKYGDIHKAALDMSKKVDEHMDEKRSVKKLIEELSVELAKPDKFNEIDQQLRMSYKVELEKFIPLNKSLEEAIVFKKQMQSDRETENVVPSNHDADTITDLLSDNQTISTTNITTHIDETIDQDIEGIQAKVDEQRSKLLKIETEITENNQLRIKRLEQAKAVDDSKRRNQELNVILNKLLVEKKAIDALVKKTKEYNDRQSEYDRIKKYVDRVELLIDEYKSLNFEKKRIIDQIGYFKTMKFAHYQVFLVTQMDEKPLDPNARAYIQFFGVNGIETVKLELNEKNYVEKGTIAFTAQDGDEFKVFVSDVEKITRIKITHVDEQRTGGVWKLEKIVIKTIAEELTFPVYRILNKSFGDGKNALELLPDEVPEKPMEDNSYEITVYTKRKLDSTDTVSLNVQLYGDKGRTKKMLLNAIELKAPTDTRSDVLCTRQFKDYFVGEINMLSVSCQDDQSAFIDHIRVRVFPYKLYKFNLNRWLSKSVGDMNTSYWQYGTDQKTLPMKKSNYKIALHLADKNELNLSMLLYIKIFGRNMATEKILLTTKNRFKPLSVKIPNVFSITSFDVGEIERVKLVKDVNETDSGVYIDKLVVNEKEFQFNCWLHDSIGKHLTEVDTSNPEEYREPRRIEYKITLVTGRKTNESSNDEFLIKIYGKEANTERHAINYAFQENKTKEVILTDCYNVGEVESIQVFFNHKNKNSWFIEKFILYVPFNNELYEFPCYCWFSRLTDSLLLRPFEEPLIKTERVGYMIKVLLNKKKLESTEGNIFLEIFGDCGIEQIFTDVNRSKLACKEKENVFKVECTNVGLIQKIFAKFDNENDTHCYLEKILIANLEGDVSSEFVFDRWLSNIIADRKTGVFGYLDSSGRHDDKRDFELKKIQYNITVTTKQSANNEQPMDADFKAFIRFIGDFVNTEKIDITRNKTGNIDFSKANWHYLQVLNYDVGTIKKIEIYTDTQVAGFLDNLFVTIFHRKPAYRFDFNRAETFRKKNVISLEPTSLIGETDKIKFFVSIESDSRIESNDSKQFFVKITGSNGSLPRSLLKTPDKRTVLSENQYRFAFLHTNIGDIEQIVFSTHFNSLFNSSWRLHRLCIQIPELAFNREFSVEGGYLLNSRTKDDKIIFNVK